MIYLASPYSHPDPAVRRARFEAACEHVAYLMRRMGRLVYSPIAHCHPIAERGLPGDWAFWAAHNRHMLVRCDELAVLTLEGWEESEGVQAEIEIARVAGIPVCPHAPTPAVETT